MSIQRYYKTKIPAILMAIQQFDLKKKALQKNAEAFAAHFGGKAVFGYSSFSIDFAGIRFNPEKPRSLWQLPDADCGYIQRPRSRLKSPIDKELKAPHKALLADWEQKFSEFFPEGRSVSRQDANKAIGYCEGTAILCGDRFLAFTHDEYVWITTTQELKVNLDEVTANEFETARKAAEGEKVTA